MDFLLFSSDVDIIGAAVKAGIDGVVIDWESAGKRQRQSGADTQISGDSLEDLKRIRTAFPRTDVVCRVNQLNPNSEREILEALDGGADQVFLPMVREPSDVQTFLSMLDGRARSGILIETESAVSNAAELGGLGLDRVYLGLNDLAIDRGAHSIFDAMFDGTVERVRSAVRSSFGFAGATIPELGFPIPCRLLLAELVRLRCDFTFLRRSFLRDVPPAAMPDALLRMRGFVERLSDRSPSRVLADHEELLQILDTRAPSIGVRKAVGHD